METLPQDLLALITRRLMLSHVSCLARTNKNFNTLIWTFVKTLTEKEMKPVTAEISFEKFKNLEECFLYSAQSTTPQDLDKLSKLRILQITFNDKDKLSLLQKLTNLQQLNVHLKVSADEMTTVLLDHTKLTSLYVEADGVSGLNYLEIMTRLRHLRLHELNSEKSLGEEFFQKLSTLTQLRGLWLSDAIDSDGSMASGMSNLTNLDDLYIYGCKTQHANSGWFIDYKELLDLQKLTRLAMMDVDLNESHTNIISRLTNLEHLELFEFSGEYELGIYSNLSKLTHIWFGLDIRDSDRGLEFNRMPYLELVSIPMCQNVTQLSHLKRLRELYLRDGSGGDQDGNICKDLNFLKELTTMQKLTIAAGLLPDENFVDLSPLSYLNHLEVSLLERNINSKRLALIGFIEGLTTVPSLSKLSIRNYLPEHLMPLITALTQLQILEVPRSAYQTALSTEHNFQICCE